MLIRVREKEGYNLQEILGIKSTCDVSKARAQQMEEG